MSHQFTRSSLYGIAILFTFYTGRLFNRVCLRASRVGSIVPNIVCVQWRLSLSPDGATEPWSILGGNGKKH